MRRIQDLPAISSEMERMPTDDKLDFHHESAALYAGEELKPVFVRELSQMWSSVSPMPLRENQKLFDAFFMLGYALALSRLGFQNVVPLAMAVVGSAARCVHVPSSDFDGRIIIVDEERQRDAIFFIHHVTDHLFGQPARIMAPASMVQDAVHNFAVSKEITAMLEARYVGGDRTVWRGWRMELFRSVRDIGWRDLARLRRNYWRARQDSKDFFATAREETFDIKNSRGGQRDIQHVWWIGLVKLAAETRDIRSLAYADVITNDDVWDHMIYDGVVEAPEIETARASYYWILALRATLKSQLLRLGEHRRVAEVFGFSASEDFLNALEMHRSRLFSFSDSVMEKYLVRFLGSS